MSALPPNPGGPSMLARVFPATRTNFPPFVATLPPGRDRHHQVAAASRQDKPGSSENRKSARKFPSTLPAANAPALGATYLHSGKSCQAGSKTPTRPNTTRESCGRTARESSDTEDYVPTNPEICGVNIMAPRNRSCPGTLAAEDSRPTPETCSKWPVTQPRTPWLVANPKPKEWCAAPSPATAPR